MANTKSALKRVRQTQTRRLRNQAAKSRIRTLRSRVMSAIEGGNKEDAEKAFRAFSSAVDRGAKSKLLHPGTADRYKSRVASQLAKA